MPHPPATWKLVELKIANYLGGQRRGADFAERDGSQVGKDDVIGLPGWSIEIKHSKQASYGLAVEALDQVDTVHEVVQGKTTPVAVIHKAGLHTIKQSIVCFRPNVWETLCAQQHLEPQPILYKPLSSRWNIVVRTVCAHTDGHFPVALVTKDREPFIALSLPNFKNYILPLRA